jgi:hypothetical protein
MTPSGIKPATFRVVAQCLKRYFITFPFLPNLNISEDSRIFVFFLVPSNSQNISVFQANLQLQWFVAFPG